MKKLVLLLCLALASYTVEAQINTPAASPGSTLVQTVGLTDVTVEYSRPSMKGRTIFGDLVPYGKIWRTGANARTKITFSQDVTIAGKELKAGSYALFTKPGESSWEIIFYTETSGGGTPQNWDDSKVALMTSSPITKFPVEMAVETFTITIDDLTDNSGVLGLLWSNVYVPIKFEVPTDAVVSESIDRVLNGPGAGDYYAAAVYYLNSGKDINKARTWMDKAMSMTEKPAFWQLRQQSLIYAKAGDKKAAIETAKKSLAAATEAGNDDYVKMNTDSLKEWGGM
ncbi:DUF2911 domain-containing protein [Maribacter algicola]|uniref:DUF2911 domain-containing protein n=1 Tax=Meishania litoralis TaxID=3434685 RepID=A0ACC7LJF0_9FLAO